MTTYVCKKFNSIIKIILTKCKFNYIIFKIREHIVITLHYDFKVNLIFSPNVVQGEILLNSFARQYFV